MPTSAGEADRCANSGKTAVSPRPDPARTGRARADLSPARPAHNRSDLKIVLPSPLTFIGRRMQGARGRRETPFRAYANHQGRRQLGRRRRGAPRCLSVGPALMSASGPGGERQSDRECPCGDKPAVWQSLGSGRSRRDPGRQVPAAWREKVGALPTADTAGHASPAFWPIAVAEPDRSADTSDSYAMS
jgi:hypothetical protein